MNKFDYLDNWDLLGENEELPDLAEMLEIALDAGDSALFEELAEIDRFEAFDREMAIAANARNNEIATERYFDGL